MTRTSWPRTSSDAATYCSPSSGEPVGSGDGGLMRRILIAAGRQITIFPKRGPANTIPALCMSP